MRRFLVVAAGVVLALLAIVLVRAATFSSRQVTVVPVEPVEVDAAGAAERLAGGLRFQTISHQDEALFPADEFRRFERYLERTYPLVHERLARERVSEHSLLYTWQGRDAPLRPGLLLAHHDVVPVEPGTESKWEHPPWEGAIAGGFVWGRGALDDKGNVFMILEAVEALLAEDYRPERTLLFAFGHDEELGGPRGATATAELLRSRGVELEYVLDEGGTIASGVMPAIEDPVAVIGIAEKGYVSIDLTVEAPGGHSSTPPRNTAVGTLSSAIHRLEANPMPASLDGPMREFVAYLGPELPFSFRTLLANLWLFGGLVEWGFGRSPATNAMVRTTTAATIFEGGVKENVLPSSARAVVNFRILPGETYEDVVDHVRQAVDDERVGIEVSSRNDPRNPSEVSPVDSAPFATLQRTIRELLPDVSVVPYLVLGGTDSRHYGIVCENVYRFSPFLMGPDDLKRLHGTNERISLETLEFGLRFYRRWILNSTGGEPPGDPAAAGSG